MMSNLALNTKNPCHPVLIAGVGNKMSILTETYDISLSKCDIPMWHKDYKANPVLNPYSFYVSYPPDTFHLAVASTVFENVTNITLCEDPNVCSLQYGGKALQQFWTNCSTEVRIFKGNIHQFVCEGFEGEIQYFLYDFTGKLLQRGITHNGEQNRLKIPCGVYLLKVIDTKGNQVVKKTVVL